MLEKICIRNPTGDVVFVLFHGCFNCGMRLTVKTAALEQASNKHGRYWMSNKSDGSCNLSREVVIYTLLGVQSAPLNIFLTIQCVD